MLKARSLKWIVEEYESEEGRSSFRCPHCGTVFHRMRGTPEDNKFFFCPSCGIRLGGIETINVKYELTKYSGST